MSYQMVTWHHRSRDH